MGGGEFSAAWLFKNVRRRDLKKENFEFLDLGLPCVLGINFFKYRSWVTTQVSVWEAILTLNHLHFIGFKIQKGDKIK